MAFLEYTHIEWASVDNRDTKLFLIKTRGGLRSEIKIKNEKSMQQGAQWKKNHKNAQFKLNKKTV